MKNALRPCLSALIVLTTVSMSLPVNGLPTVKPASANYETQESHIYLTSKAVHDGDFDWKMIKASDLRTTPEQMSTVGFDTREWLDAVVPGTVLTSLVHDGQLPDPYYGTNNKMEEGLIPDIAKVGRDYYTYWFRTEVDIPADYQGKRIWLQPNGINYRGEVWVNGCLVSVTAGMFMRDYIDVTDFVQAGQRTAIAVLVRPVDMPGTKMPKTWGAVNEFHNGGDGNIGYNTTMLMTVGWDFMYMDGIRDRNTGIWRGMELYATGQVAMRYPFVKSRLDHPRYDVAHETVSVELVNPSKENKPVTCEVSGEIVGEGITFSKQVSLQRGAHTIVTFTPEEYSQLVIRQPRLWWPVNKGPQNLYELKMKVSIQGVACDSVKTRFGIREVTTTRETPDSSKLFVVNGKRIFIRGSNWLPEAMQRTDDRRMAAELRYSAQSGLNMIRLWGGGIPESDLFYQLCDEYGLLVWQEFFMTGDTRHPHDESIYFNNVGSTVKRIRNHPSVAFYVASNESSEVTGMRERLAEWDGTRPFQMQSECDGIHDGSPYKQVNPMRHYENTASNRGSRIDGFNPEYGAPTLPLAESLRQLMPADKLWPIDKVTWDYLDGNGFNYMTSLYRQLTDCYGPSATIEQYAKRSQLVGAMNSKSIWEVWNENKFDYGDRWCSGVLFWYHNCASPRTSGSMWDHSLEPTASLFHTMHSLEPLHVQFDYLKNTVSVVNDYLNSYRGYSVTAQVYDFSSHKLWEQSHRVDIPEDGVVNDVITVDFPQDISQIHFINLLLKDEKGDVVSENFYWRSKDKYEGKQTVTGPCVSGFEQMSNMTPARLKTKKTVNTVDGRRYIQVILKNTSKVIAFFNQLHLFNADGQPVKPAFYSDNFFTLLPGESKTISIEADETLAGGKPSLRLEGWNVPAVNL